MRLNVSSISSVHTFLYVYFILPVFVLSSCKSNLQRIDKHASGPAGWPASDSTDTAGGVPPKLLVVDIAEIGSVIKDACVI